MTATSRGDVWLIDYSEAIGREQQGRRPGLVVSVDEFNSGPADLLMTLPMTTRDRGLVSHVNVLSPEGGLKRNSFVMCENIRSISKQRLVRKLGEVTNATMMEVEERLRVLMDL